MIMKRKFLTMGLVPIASIVGFSALGAASSTTAFASPASAGTAGSTSPCAAGLSNAENAKSLTVPSGCSEYFYVGSSAGGAAVHGTSWTPDLSVTATYSGLNSVSVGRSSASSGSFKVKSQNHAIAGVGTEGYTVSHVYTAQTSVVQSGACPGCGLGAEAGPSLNLTFSSNGTDPVLILVGGEGTGNLVLSGVLAGTLDNATFSGDDQGVLASEGIFEAVLPAGSYTATFASTTNRNNSGESLGAVAYELSS
jgi:hypothetical protein